MGHCVLVADIARAQAGEIRKINLDPSCLASPSSKTRFMSDCITVRCDLARGCIVRPVSVTREGRVVKGWGGSAVISELRSEVKPRGELRGSPDENGRVAQ